MALSDKNWGSPSVIEDCPGPAARIIPDRPAQSFLSLLANGWAGRFLAALKVLKMKRYSSLPPHERAAFLAEKANRFLEALARELDLLDPALKRSAACFQRGATQKRFAGAAIQTLLTTDPT